MFDVNDKNMTDGDFSCKVMSSASMLCCVDLHVMGLYVVSVASCKVHVCYAVHSVESVKQDMCEFN